MAVMTLSTLCAHLFFGFGAFCATQAELDAEMDDYWLGSDKGKDKLDAGALLCCCFAVVMLCCYDACLL
jgi:hypothetical protein